MGTINCGCDDESDRKFYENLKNIKEYKKDVHYKNLTILKKPKIDEDSSEDDIQNKLEKAERIPIFPFSPRKKQTTINDFELKSVIGKGSFGKVLLVEKKYSGMLYAMKVLKKKNIVKRNQRLHTQYERKILEEMNDHPFIVQLHYAFQTEKKLYIVMDFMQGGELFFHLKRSFKFTESRARLYIAEIILALEALHKNNIVYRDLKPENILLGDDGHIKICDFGLSKQVFEDDGKTYTFCGTPEYLAPEIILGIYIFLLILAKGHDKAVDWWSLGTLLYEMLTGSSPFFAINRKKIYHSILEMKPYFSDEASSLLKSAGPDDANEIKKHPFFTDIDFDKVYKKEYEPLFKPRVNTAVDLRNFDKIFLEESFDNSSNSFDDKNVNDNLETSNNFSNFSDFSYCE